MSRTELGKIPNGWRWLKLGEVCELNPRRPLKLTRKDDALTSFVPMSAVDETLGIIMNPEKRAFKDVSKGYTFFAENDILFAKITPCMQNGKQAIARNLIDGIGFGSTEFHVLRSTDQTIPEWIHFYIRQPIVLRNAMSCFTGAVGQQRVPEYFLENLSIPLPPLPEQKRIAEILNEQMAAVEKARVAAEAQREAARALSSAYLRKVFKFRTGNKLPQGWRWVRLGEIGEFLSGGTPAKEESRYWKGNIPFVTGADITELYISENNARAFLSEEGLNSGKTAVCQKGTVLFVTRTRVGRIGIASCLMGASQDLSPYICSGKILPEFLCRYINNISEYLIVNCRGATIKGLTRDFVENIFIPLPTLPEQRRFAATLNEQMAEAEQLKESVAEQIETIISLPAVLLRQAFGGEL